MESLTNRFEQRIAEFLRRTQLMPSELGERAIGDRKFCGDLRRGRSPKLATGFWRSWRPAAGLRTGLAVQPAQREPLGFYLERRRDGEMTRAVEPGRDAPARILRFQQVRARTGLSRSTIYRRLAEGPSPTRSNSAHARSAGSSRRWMSGSTSGSRRAATKLTDPKGVLIDCLPFDTALVTEEQR